MDGGDSVKLDATGRRYRDKLHVLATSSCEHCCVSQKKSPPKWFLPGWAHRQLKKKARFAKLRALHGDACWRCNHPMTFDGPPNCGKAATIEHLQPLSKGGSWNMDNLRLCHVGCNRHLKDYPPEQKERMRINLQRG